MGRAKEFADLITAEIGCPAPFGGFKASGLGRECGPEGVDAYLETQTIVLPGDYVPSA